MNRAPYKRKAGSQTRRARRLPQAARHTVETDCFFDYVSFSLAVEVPHDAALQSEVVLRSATEVRVQVVELDRPKGDVPR